MSQEKDMFSIDKGLIYNYLQVLLGETSYSKVYFGKAAKETSRYAICVFRYAFDYLLRWSPKMVERYLNEDILKIMCLDKIYTYLPFPVDIRPNVDYWYVAHMLYPDEIPYNEEERVINTYKLMLAGKGDGGLYRFPRHYFDNEIGRKRAFICLRFFIDRFCYFRSTEEMYQYFSSEAAEKELDAYALKLVWRQVFGSPVVYLNEMLSEDERNDFLFHYYEFLFRYRKESRNLKNIQKLEKQLEKKVKKNAL